MAASNVSTALRVAIIGITGTQGASVANALIASPKPYHLIGLTRSLDKPASKEWVNKGVEMKEVTIAVGNEDTVRAALQGADVVFVSLEGVGNCVPLATSNSQLAYVMLLQNRSR